MIATRTVQGNNSGPYLRHPKIVVMHSTRSGLAEFTDAQELGATINWFTNPDGASSHWVISETERARVVTDDLIAWHSTYLNSRAWGIELTQPTIDRPYRDGHYANVALVGWRYIKLGVAPKWLDYWDGDVSVRFIASLEDDMLSAEDKEFILAQTKFLETRQNDHGVVRDLQHAEVMAKLNALQVGGVDVAALAKAVADETALRMKD
jgi:hypothetical protein